MTESDVVERLSKPGVLLRLGGRLEELLREDVPVRDRYKQKRAEQ
jgi:hypothetical protein